MRRYLISYEDRFGRYAYAVTTDPEAWKALMIETIASGDKLKNLRERLKVATFEELVTP